MVTMIMKENIKKEKKKINETIKENKNKIKE